ncbi:hypothetical protein FBY40_3079 [Microbacterium sp. SLBN-154]|uniref:DUF6226 family protein n=1 Tax=Microbacterium sp. SLBN-154 TaxID=2768458 RepID=UPI00115139E8|nr:DUF6226 family protein [Microbacterium sp. SLBN-154]TQK20542.1 hypothetical protein FBY40_3079 [Microbacterium sp. SLBN-154]
MVLEYSRPQIEDVEFWDDNGTPVAYGARRKKKKFPELGPRGAEANVFSHQERYAPIFLVADGLIAHLAAKYDAVVDDDVRFSMVFDILNDWPIAEFERVVRILPTAADQAPLHIGFLSVPGSVRVLAGSFSEFDMWFCGCDACDEPWEEIADSLEHVVLAVSGHGLTERMDKRRRGYARYWLDPTRRREWSGALPKRGMRADALATATASTLRAHRGTWRPWTVQNSD